MSKIRCRTAISLDGYTAGPNQSLENPLGEGGEDLHTWMVGLKIFREEHGDPDGGGDVNASTAVIEESLANVGAGIMGRNMFGGGPGAWNTTDPWLGWWGDNPPFHHPILVLTHHPREPLTLSDTTFTFVTEGPAAALAQARSVAGGKDITINGGAATIQQFLAAGLLDELELHLAPIILGAGERLFTNIGDVKLEQIRAVEAPGVTHLKYRVVK
jgi:dihydrofolate reductase